jgi:hypothetical protein
MHKDVATGPHHDTERKGEANDHPKSHRQRALDALAETYSPGA